MKVTFLLPPITLTGGNKVVAIHAQYLVEQGVEVHVVAPAFAALPLRARLRNLWKSRGESAKSRPPSHFDKLKVPYRVLESHRPIGNADVPDADIVVATWWETAEWMQALAPSKGRKVHFVQGHEVFVTSQLERVKAVYAAPSPKIVVSNWLQRVLSAQHDATRTLLAQNGVDAHYFRHAPRPRPAQRTVGLLLSRAKEVKGMVVAMDVLERARAAFPDVRVLAFAADTLVGHLQVPDFVALSIDPAPSQIKDIYESCDVWLSCSTNEGFNLTVVEALAAGTPVVATRVGWPDGGIVGGVNGFVHDVDDVASLTGSVCRLLGMDDADWAVVSEAARQSVDGLTWRQSSAQFHEALKAIQVQQSLAE
jgi:glycosyltransferase involved in cell wall biosynthesis